ncbi:putative methylase [Durotheca rogersii]|uniref:putative methylase n=1 Tax=Durotheca rogersii TaxID=419775 RepID=UPI00222078BD|nr:putative methylase [Durotheca rogersii]KAI5862124.1 putative methylase [Durotheca rogersii]
MLPTPDTSHVPYERVYEPAEDSFLLLDTLSSAGETAFLRSRFGGSAPASSPARVPLVLEVGCGSGVVVAFVNAHAGALFGTPDVLAAAVDLNPHACRATRETVRRAAAAAAADASSAPCSSSSSPGGSGTFLGAARADLASPFRDRCVDVLVFNPPYVPTPSLPSPPAPGAPGPSSFDDDAYLLALSYAGGRDGMETTERLLAALPRALAPRGCAYVLLCAQNRPDAVKARARALGPRWRADTVATSGKRAGWERLQVVRIWTDEERGPDGGGEAEAEAEAVPAG